MANNKKNTSRCVEKLGNGKRCNKPVVEGTSHCKKHSSEKKELKKKSRIYFPSGDKLAILLFIAASVLATIYFVIPNCSGPTKENQEQGLENQEKIIEQTNKDTLREIFKSLIPQDSTVFYKQQNLFNKKLKEYTDLVSRFERLNKNISKSVDSLAKIQNRIDSLVSIWNSQVYSFEYKYKNIVNEANNPLKDIFEYGYATYLIDPTQKLHLIDQFNNEKDGPILDWSTIKIDVSERTIHLEIDKINYTNPTGEVLTSTFGFGRFYNDLGVLYSFGPAIGNTSNVVSVVSETADGIIVIVGFKKLEADKEATDKIVSL